MDWLDRWLGGGDISHFNLANGGAVSAIFLLKFLGFHGLADNPWCQLVVGSVLILAMTAVSARGITLSEHLQNLLMAFQFLMLIIVSVLALIKVYTGSAGPQAIMPKLSWLWPSGLTGAQIATATILCVFLYWGFDSCLAVGEETKESQRVPGVAAMLTILIIMITFVLSSYALQSFSGFGDTGIGLNNPANVEEVLTEIGGPIGGVIASSLLLLTVSISALSSVQTGILPTARATLSMAVYEAIPHRFASMYQRFMTPVFGTVVIGVGAVGLYALLTSLSREVLADSISSLGLAVAFYYGLTAFSCVWYFRRSLFTSVRHFLVRGLFPLLGGIAMAWAFVKSAIDMFSPDFGHTHFGPVGGVFVFGVGMLLVGIPLMLLCYAVGTKRFFRGETLTASTEAKVLDIY